MNNYLKKIKKAKPIAELSNKRLKEYSIIASDSVLLYDAIFDELDEKLESEKEHLVELANKFAIERKHRGI
jgi:hypothetical protein